jgi:deoxyadenosine/deoxycytidine kinase
MFEPPVGIGEPPTKTRIVEIVGPAGAGKTTVSEILSCHHKRVQLGRFPDVHKKSDAPFFVYYSLSLLPFLVSSCLGKGCVIKRRSLAWLAILKGWPRRLQIEKKRSDKVVVLDQGPIYFLAETSELGPDCLKSPRAVKFWEEVYARWRNTLDAVIWLDADNAHLHQRIRSRATDHVVKYAPTPKVFDFLDRYRMAYQEVFSRLNVAEGGLRIIRIDTGQEKPEEIAARLAVELGLKDESL